MKKHGSATKRAFDELMSKSDACAHRIGKDQNRQDITGTASVPASARRGRNIETLSEKAFSKSSRTVAAKEITTSQRAASVNTSSDADKSMKASSVSMRSSADLAAVGKNASSPDRHTAAESNVSPIAIEAAKATSTAPKKSAQITRVYQPCKASQSHDASENTAQLRREANPTAAETSKRPAAVSHPAAEAYRHRTVRAAAPDRATPSKHRRTSGRTLVRRAAICAVAAFAVVFVAVTVYAISSDRNEPVYPDVLIGGGEVEASEGMSVVSSLSVSDTDTAQETYETDAFDASDTIYDTSENDAADANASEDDTSEQSKWVDTRFTVTFMFYQEDSIVCSTPETTVGALMERLGITAGEGKRMYVSTDDVISADTEIRIDTVEYKTEYGTEAVAYTTEYQDIRTIPRGTTQLCRSGQNGVKTVEYLCEYVNGELNSRETRGESITTAPVSQILYRGIGGTIGGYSYSYYIDVQATTYTGGGTTASGLPATESVIAVDPSVIPLGTKVYVAGSYGDFGVRTAADTGGSIVGNKIDVYLDSSNPYFANFGWRSMRVYILG